MSVGLASRERHVRAGAVPADGLSGLDEASVGREHVAAERGQVTAIGPAVRGRSPSGRAPHLGDQPGTRQRLRRPAPGGAFARAMPGALLRGPLRRCADENYPLVVAEPQSPECARPRRESHAARGTGRKALAPGRASSLTSRVTEQALQRRARGGRVRAGRALSRRVEEAVAGGLRNVARSRGGRLRRSAPPAQPEVPLDPAAALRPCSHCRGRLACATSAGGMKCYTSQWLTGTS